jgi:small-conductance mechanosensitive channel
MKKLNIRRFATPLIIGAGVISALTGVLMFFTTEQPFLFAHEIVGLGFAVAIVLHIYTNWRPFKKYFSQRSVIIIALAWLIGVGLVARTAIFSEGEPEELIMEKIEQTSLMRIAPIVDMDVETLIKRLGDDGFTVSDPEMSIEALAEKHGADTDTVLLSVFRE